MGVSSSAKEEPGHSSAPCPVGCALSPKGASGMGELESPDGCWWLRALAAPSPTLGWGLLLLACHQFSPRQ